MNHFESQSPDRIVVVPAFFLTDGNKVYIQLPSDPRAATIEHRGRKL